jgi:hypothetical protein
MKIVYVVVALAITRGLAVAIGLMGIGQVIRQPVGHLLELSVILVGARIFRGPGEGWEPRPWWRMTNKPTLSLVVGILFTVYALYCLYIFVSVATGFTTRPISPGLTASLTTEYGQDAVLYGILGLVYGTSCVQLRRLSRAHSVPNS